MEEEFLQEEEQKEERNLLFLTNQEWSKNFELGDSLI